MKNYLVSQVLTLLGPGHLFRMTLDSQVNDQSTAKSKCPCRYDVVIYNEHGHEGVD